MNIRQKLNHALAFGYPVRVTWRRGNGEGVEDGWVCCIMQNGFKFNGDHRKHDYAYIASVEPVEPEAEEAENVYEYIKRKIGEITLGTLSARGVRQVIDQAQRKFGSVDGEPEEVNEKPDVISAATVALLDCLGALVNIRDAKRRTMQGVDLHDPNVTITMTVDDWMVVVDALKKARVE